MSALCRLRANYTAYPSMEQALEREGDAPQFPRARHDSQLDLHPRHRELQQQQEGRSRALSTRSWLVYWSLAVATLAASIGAPGLSASSEGRQNHAIRVFMRAYFLSSWRVLILANVTLATVAFSAHLLQRYSFGKLSDEERSSSWNSCLYFAAYNGVFLGIGFPPFSAADMFIRMIMLAVPCVARYFSIIGKHRYMREVNSNSPRIVFHSKANLFTWFCLADILWLALCYDTFKQAGTETMALLLADSVISLIEMAHVAVLNYCQVLHLDGRADLERSESTVFYLESYFETGRHTLALLHHLHIWYLHGLSFSVVDFFLLSFLRTISKKFYSTTSAYFRYRKMENELRSAYDDATPEDIAELNDNCAICREAMSAGKKLPCGHIFHLSCLRQWMKYRRNCPICRSLLSSSTRPVPRASQYPAAARDDGRAASEGLAQPVQPPQASASPRSIIHFESPAWLRQLGSISFQLGFSAGDPTQSISEMFPNVPREAIVRELRRTRSAERTIENLLAGRSQPEHPPVQREPSASSPST